MSSSHRCDRHGAVLPRHSWSPATSAALDGASRTSRVPLWAPLPLPPGWSVGGLELVEDQRGRARAATLALCGPGPLGGPADILLISEEPAVGLVAHRAGLPELDLLPMLGTAPDAKIHAAGHPTALWRLPSPDDRVALAGEAGGVWFAVVLWPAVAELLLAEQVALYDLRDTPRPAELPIGAACPHLS